MRKFCILTRSDLTIDDPGSNEILSFCVLKSKRDGKPFNHLTPICLSYMLLFIFRKLVDIAKNRNKIDREGVCLCACVAQSQIRHICQMD